MQRFLFQQVPKTAPSSRFQPYWSLYTCVYYSSCLPEGMFSWPLLQSGAGLDQDACPSVSILTSLFMSLAHWGSSETLWLGRGCASATLQHCRRHLPWELIKRISRRQKSAFDKSELAFFLSKKTPQPIASFIHGNRQVWTDAWLHYHLLLHHENAKQSPKGTLRPQNGSIMLGVGGAAKKFPCCAC